MDPRTLKHAPMGTGIGATGAGIVGAKMSDDPDTKRYMGMLTSAGIIGALGTSEMAQTVLKHLHPFSSEGRKLEGRAGQLNVMDKAERFSNPLGGSEKEVMEDLMRELNGLPPKPKKRTIDPAYSMERRKELKGRFDEIEKPHVTYSKQLKELQDNLENSKAYLNSNPEILRDPERQAAAQQFIEESVERLKQHVEGEKDIMKSLRADYERKIKPLMREDMTHRANLEQLTTPRPASTSEELAFLKDQLADIYAADANKNLALGAGLGVGTGALLGYRPPPRKRKEQ